MCPTKQQTKYKTQPPTRTSLTNVWARSVSHNKKQKNKDARVHYTVLTQHTTPTTTKEQKHSPPALTMLDVRNNPHTPPKGDACDVIPDTQQHATHCSRPCGLVFVTLRGHLHPIKIMLMATTYGFQHQQPTNQTQSDVG